MFNLYDDAIHQIFQSVTYNKMHVKNRNKYVVSEEIIDFSEHASSYMGIEKVDSKFNCPCPQEEIAYPHKSIPSKKKRGFVHFYLSTIEDGKFWIEVHPVSHQKKPLRYDESWYGVSYLFFFRTKGDDCTELINIIERHNN